MSPFKATKDELYANINRIEREISEAETQILKLKKKQQELEASSKSSGVDGRPTHETIPESKQQQSIAQLVYSDNRRKAQSSHSQLEKLNGPPVPVIDNLNGMVCHFNHDRSCLLTPFLSPIAALIQPTLGYAGLP